MAYRTSFRDKYAHSDLVHSASESEPDAKLDIRFHDGGLHIDVVFRKMIEEQRQKQEEEKAVIAA